MLALITLAPADGLTLADKRTLLGTGGTSNYLALLATVRTMLLKVAPESTPAPVPTP